MGKSNDPKLVNGREVPPMDKSLQMQGRWIFKALKAGVALEMLAFLYAMAYWFLIGIFGII